MSADHDIDRANRRAGIRKAKYPAALSAHYDATAKKVVIRLANGVDLSFPPTIAEGLEGARASQLSEIEVTAAGTGIHFPKLDADLYVPGLIERAMGSRQWMAARLGAQGGRARTPQKAAASRENGKRGGRPKSRRSAYEAS